MEDVNRNFPILYFYKRRSDLNLREFCITQLSIIKYYKGSEGQ